MADTQKNEVVDELPSTLLLIYNKVFYYIHLLK